MKHTILAPVALVLFLVGCGARVEPSPVPDVASSATAAPIVEYEAHATGVVQGDPQGGAVILVRAWCNAGDAILSGGCLAGDARVHVLGSTPVVAAPTQGEPASWACTISNGTDQVLGASAYALCQVAK